jgi:hypothetical protein
MAPDFTTLVETHTGRRVRAFMSQVHLEPDVDVEIFVLEPSPGTG